MSHPLRVLIVEDDLDFAESLAVYLGMEGHAVECVESGEEALARFAPGRFDAAFMDLRLPSMSGIDTFLVLRRIDARAKVILMTAYSVESLLTQAIDAGALAVLRKPFDPAVAPRLLESVRPAGIVLLVDDDRDFSEAIAESLRGADYEVLVAHDGHDAVERVMAEGIDVLVLDLRLPIMSGLEVYLALRERGRSLPTVIVTGYGLEETDALDSLRRFDVSGCLFKPFDPSELLAILDSVVEGRR